MPVLVVLTCIYNTGCADTSRAYYLSNAELQTTVRNIEEKAKQKLGDRATTYAMTALLALTGQHYVIKLTDRITIEGSPGWTVTYSLPF